MEAIEIFLCYSHEDEKLRNIIAKLLRRLERQGQITVWYDREIGPGKEWAREIDLHLNTAQIILLLISLDFVASDYCYTIEMQKALERHAAETARVIPIILRPVFWEDTPFSKLQVLPSNTKPVTLWSVRDSAFLDIDRGIRKAIEELSAKPSVDKAC